MSGITQLLALSAKEDAVTPSYSSSADVAARLAMVIGRMNRRIRPAGGGLSHASLSALATVSKSGSIRLADLAEREVVAAPSITRIVADLERRGLVTRRVNETDRRAFLIEATGEGEQALSAARAKRAVLVTQLLQGLDPAELQAVAAALPALERAIENI
jgi:DNA-binding MarR family transcriptional regulator